MYFEMRLASFEVFFMIAQMQTTVEQLIDQAQRAEREGHPLDAIAACEEALDHDELTVHQSNALYRVYFQSLDDAQQYVKLHDQAEQLLATAERATVQIEALLGKDRKSVV